MINSNQLRSMTKEEKDEKFAKIWFQALAWLGFTLFHRWFHGSLIENKFSPT